jgi:hypothetical protein
MKGHPVIAIRDADDLDIEAEKGGRLAQPVLADGILETGSRTTTGRPKRASSRQSGFSRQGGRVGRPLGRRERSGFHSGRAKEGIRAARNMWANAD